MKPSTVWIVMFAALAAACSHIPKEERDRQDLERYMHYAGTPVESFTYLGSYTGWRPLGRDRAVFWTGINDAYMITVAQPCDSLEFAGRIGLTSTGGTVHAKFDHMRVDGQSCQIDEIRPVDYLALKRDQRAEHGSG